MSEARTPGSTGNCPRCGAMVRWATLAATGRVLAVQPMREPRLLSYVGDEPYRNVQEIQALVPHAPRCKARTGGS